MNEHEPLRIESKSSKFSFVLRNQELLILVGASLISYFLTYVTYIGYLKFFIFFSIIFVIGKKRGSFVNSGLEYVIMDDRIKLYSNGKFFRSYDLEGSSVNVEDTIFGKNIVIKKSVTDYLKSDSVFGFVNDLGKNSYEFLIYNCSDTERVINYLKLNESVNIESG